MRRVWERLVSPSPKLRDPGARRQARLLAVLLVFTIPALVCIDLAFTLTHPDYLPPWYGYTFLFGVYALSRSRHHVWGAGVFALMFPTVATIGSATGRAPDLTLTLAFMVCGPLIGTIFLGTRGTVALTALNIAVLALLPSLAPTVDLTAVEVTELIALNVIVGGLLVLHVHHRDALEREREALLREAEERLREAQRLESLGRLAAGVAHDFNNLLLVVRGNAELLQFEHESSELAEIVHAVESGEALVKRLLTAGRQATLRTEVVDINVVTNAAAEMIRRLLGEHIELHVELEPEPWPTRLDPHQVEQALLNLATNARDAMPDGGRLTLRTRNRPLAREELAGESQARPGDWVSVEVADTGHGMTDEVRRRVFEPFFTTKARGKGTGLGLAMVNGTVTQCEGWVRVRSVVGIGTRIELLFPRA